MHVVVDPSRELSSPSLAQIELKLLGAELAELREAVESGCTHLVLDEVTDVIYRARAVASQFGLSTDMLQEYATLKSKLRACVGKDKNLELNVAHGVVNCAAHLPYGK